MVIRSRISKEDRQYYGQKKKDKRTNNDLQNTTQKTKDRPTQTPAKTSAVNLRAPEEICSSFSAFDTRSVYRHISTSNHVAK